MWNVLLFEINYRRRRPATYIYFLIFFLMAFLASTTDAIQIGGGAGQVKENSPYVITNMMLILGAFCMIIASAVMGVPILRDWEHNTASMFFTTPVKKWQYLFGRFLGSLLVLVFIYAGMFVGFALGPLMPWMEAENMVPFNIMYYISPFVVFILPNIFILSAIFFAGGALSKSMVTVFFQGALLLVLYLISFQFINDLENKTIAALIDPFGLNAFSYFTQYWTIAERNSMTVPLEGAILANRLLWVSIAVIITGVTYIAFRFDVSASKALRLRRKKAKPAEKLNPEAISIPTVQQHSGWRTHVKQTLSMSFFYFSWIRKQIPFIAIVSIGMLMLFVNAMNWNRAYGVYTYMTSYSVVELISTFNLFFLIIIVFYTGELIWKERDVKINLIYDALPYPNYVTVTGKFLAMVYVHLSLLVMLLVAGVLVQLSKGYGQIELGVYLGTMFRSTLSFLLLYTLLGFFIQVLLNHKFLGYAAFVVFFILIDILPVWGIEHNMFQFAASDFGTFSEMNKFGHYMGGWSWFQVYWFGLALVLFSVSVLFSVRGADVLFKTRARLSKLRFTRPMLSFVVFTFLTFSLSGCYIYYNTTVVNQYANSDARQERQADYEKELKQYDRQPQPKVVDINLKMDLYPQTRDYVAQGYYILKNKHSAPISEIHIQENSDFQISNEVSFTRNHGVKQRWDNFRFTIYELEAPLAPGDTLKMYFKTTFTTDGFVESGSSTNVVYNGTFINNTQFPSIGYNTGLELGDDNTRRDYDLAPKERLPERDDAYGLTTSLFGDDADHIQFEIVMGTDTNQIAISPGYLQREWVEGDRRYFHYKMDTLMAPFFSMVSADYTIQRDKWIDPRSGKEVNLEIYYHEGHEYNLDRMMRGLKESLGYFTKNFSPFQYRQLRIMEFPRYASFAQSFANTIPFSEDIGFIQKIGEDDVDMPFYVTSHEVAHQWWGHQVTEAGVKGNAMLSETLSQYSALMVMKKNYSEEKMQKFLKYELDRYLRGRTTETKKEQPIEFVESQGYIHYRKGSLLMYAFQDYVGEDSVNAALRRYLNRWAWAEGRYPTTKELLGYFKEVTPDSLQWVIKDFFETITLYENKANTASYTEVGEGQYTVSLDYSSIKYRADSLGNETALAQYNDWIDIGVYGEDENGDEKLLYLKKHKINPTGNGAEKGTATIEITVSSKPTRAGIDPLNKLVDRTSDDNVTAVTVKEST